MPGGYPHLGLLRSVTAFLVPLLILIPALPFAVMLVLFLVALLRCDRADIPAIITALAEVVNALRLRRRQ
jgi:hypothetical protein